MLSAVLLAPPELTNGTADAKPTGLSDHNTYDSALDTTAGSGGVVSRAKSSFNVLWYRYSGTSMRGAADTALHAASTDHIADCMLQHALRIQWGPDNR